MSYQIIKLMANKSRELLERELKAKDRHIEILYDRLNAMNTQLKDVTGVMDKILDIRKNWLAELAEKRA